MKTFLLLIMVGLVASSTGCQSCKCGKPKAAKPKPAPMTQIQMVCSNCSQTVWVVPTIVTNDVLKLLPNRTQINRTITARCVLERRGWSLVDHRTLLTTTDIQVYRP